MSLICAKPSQILPTVLPFEFGMGMETVIDCAAICPQTTYLPLTNELLGQTLREVVCQLLELRPILVNVVRTLLIFWDKLLMASVVVLPLPVTWTFRVAISGFTLRVAAPVTSIVFQPQLAAHPALPGLPSEGKEGLGRVILGKEGKVGGLILRELPCRLLLWVCAETISARTVRRSADLFIQLFL